ncbi:IclR family transcriptional regulator [Amycolatopsis jiangsuensis]|uniref:DNA-binding IclR family transcriptional regulator n=1 Tax=Amycolatopsis jiangsuensis TaxID=1181879 RepID=A0A840J3B4_9PSEU|nr:IclR family transcriptional regulator [Amycolatopsis jiangsuensis]MBB4688209.1 DNA-binding IclR family transcriptional regulator [Amycolatopsis jiangsuensis]
MDERASRTEGGETARRALRLLDTVARSSKPRRMAELSEEAGINRSTGYRLLRILQEEGYLEHTADGYGVGSKLVALAAAALPRHDDYLVARPLLRALAYRTGETVGLHRRSGDRAVLVLTAENQDHPLRHVAQVGESVPLARGCTGMSMLVQLPPHEVEQVLSRAGAGAATAPQDVARARERGWSYSVEANHAGIAGFAVPVPADDRRAEPMTLGVSGPLGRMNQEVAHRFAPLLAEAATRLAELGVNTGRAG